MHFYFADQEELVKQPVHVFLPKPLIARTEHRMGKPVTFVTPAFHLITELP